MESRKDKKVMFVVPSLEGGGAERVAANLLKRFSNTAFDVTLVLFSRKKAYELPGGIKVRYIDAERYGCALIKFLLTIIALRKIIKEEKPSNILGFMDYTNIVVILSNMLLLNRARAAASVHTSPTLHLRKYSKNIPNSIISLLIRLLYNKADSIIAVSDFIRDDLIGNFGIDRTKITTIYNPVDIDKINIFAEEDVFHPWFEDNIPIILSAGRLSKEKGFDYLLKAFAVVKGKMNARLMILGEGEEDKNLRELSRMLGIDRDVDFAGFQKNPYNFMKHSAIYVLPSLYEGFPVVLVEAMTCGIPVVSTVYNPGMNEIVEHEKNGLLVPVQDEKSLAEAIQRLLADPEEGKRLVHEAKKKVRELSLENIVMQYKKILLGAAE